MGKNYEIDRKFLVEFPNISELDVKRRIGIVQTYLRSGENGSQRRVRSVDENGSVKYTYTEKVFLTPVTREENEYEISREEYRSLLGQVRSDCPPVEKVRYCFDYHDQLFELDTYPFSDKRAQRGLIGRKIFQFGSCSRRRFPRTADWRKQLMSEKFLQADSPEQLSALFGQLDGNISRIQKDFNVTVVSRDGGVKIIGDGDTEGAEKALRAIMKMANDGNSVNEQTVRYVSSMVADGAEQELQELGGDGICVTASGKILRPRTVGQKRYTEAIKNNTIVLGIGPAGTGKTYLAVAMAVKAFREHKIKKIILTRPAVEAGEKLGFLPGDLQDKVDPYLRPLYDALFDMFGAESFARYMEKGIIEVAPLAYMRGRTLDEAFIILDEAQNTTSEQIKMFLTRLGNESRMVITGDITQIDLPDTKKSGLVEAVKVLRGIDDIEIHRFTEKDVVRHRLVQDIIKAYEKYNEGRKNNHG